MRVLTASALSVRTRCRSGETPLFMRVLTTSPDCTGLWRVGTAVGCTPNETPKLVTGSASSIVDSMLFRRCDRTGRQIAQRSSNTPHLWSLKIPYPPDRGGRVHERDSVERTDAPRPRAGLKAVEHGHRVLFATAAGLIAALTKGAAEGATPPRACSSSTKSATCPSTAPAPISSFRPAPALDPDGPRLTTCQI